MKVEIWSDIACPFCWIGKHHFEKAVHKMGLMDVKVEWKSFELDPHANQDYEDDLYALLANKYGQSREWALNSAEHMRQKGERIGLEFNFDRTISTNTFDAHRLIHLAKTRGKQIEAEEALFSAYFKDGKHIGKKETLLEIGVALGMDKVEVKKTLESEAFSKDVRQDELLSQQFRITGVPFFVINRKYGISGAQPVEHFIKILNNAKTDEEDVQVDQNAEGDSCGVDGCQ